MRSSLWICGSPLLHPPLWVYFLWFFLALFLPKLRRMGLWVVKGRSFLPSYKAVDYSNAKIVVSKLDPTNEYPYSLEDICQLFERQKEGRSICN